MKASKTNSLFFASAFVCAPSLWEQTRRQGVALARFQFICGFSAQTFRPLILLCSCSTANVSALSVCSSTTSIRPANKLTCHLNVRRCGGSWRLPGPGPWGLLQRRAGLLPPPGPGSQPRPRNRLHPRSRLGSVRRSAHHQLQQHPGPTGGSRSGQHARRAGSAHRYGPGSAPTRPRGDDVLTFVPV